MATTPGSDTGGAGSAPDQTASGSTDLHASASIDLGASAPVQPQSPPSGAQPIPTLFDSQSLPPPTSYPVSVLPGAPSLGGAGLPTNQQAFPQTPGAPNTTIDSPPVGSCPTLNDLMVQSLTQQGLMPTYPPQPCPPAPPKTCPPQIVIQPSGPSGSQESMSALQAAALIQREAEQSLAQQEQAITSVLGQIGQRISDSLLYQSNALDNIEKKLKRSTNSSLNKIQRAIEKSTGPLLTNVISSTSEQIQRLGQIAQALANAKIPLAGPYTVLSRYAGILPQDAQQLADVIGEGSETAAQLADYNAALAQTPLAAVMNQGVGVSTFQQFAPSAPQPAPKPAPIAQPAPAPQPIDVCACINAAAQLIAGAIAAASGRAGAIAIAGGAASASAGATPAAVAVQATAGGIAGLDWNDPPDWSEDYWEMLGEQETRRAKDAEESLDYGIIQEFE